LDKSNADWLLVAGLFWEKSIYIIVDCTKKNISILELQLIAQG
jgi:hypothetical protein